MWYGLGAAKRKGSRAGWRTNKGTSGGRMDKVNLSQRFSPFTSHWDPKIVGEVNGHRVKLVKFHGPFVWHRHENEDELFLVHKGRFTMEFRDRRVAVEEGEFITVPRNTEQRPVAEEEVPVVLFEPVTTLNTGDAESGLTVKQPERI